MQVLLQYDPNERATVRGALGMIEWVDHRRGNEGTQEERNDEDEDENKGDNGGEDDSQGELNAIWEIDVKYRYLFDYH